MIRPLRPGDAPELLELWNRSVRFDPLSASVLHEKVWDDSGAGLVWDDGGLQGFCYAVWRPANGRGYVKLLCVAPEFRRTGIATQLLAKAEVYLAGRGAPVVRVCESNPNYLVPGLDPRYTAGVLFFEKHGYVKVAETYNMRCQLAGQEFSTVAPPGLTVRRAEFGDQASVLELIVEHFPAWHSEVLSMFANDPISLHLAFKDGKLAAFSGYDGNNRGTGWFGPMGTDPKLRGLGAGGVLLRRCLVDFQEQGLQDCVIPWVGPYRFYSQNSGAYIDRVFWRLEKRLTPG